MSLSLFGAPLLTSPLAILLRNPLLTARVDNVYKAERVWLINISNLQFL